MLRTAFHSCARAGRTLLHLHRHVGFPFQSICHPQSSRCFSALISKETLDSRGSLLSSSLGNNHSSHFRQQNIVPLILEQQSRPVTKFSLGKGKRRTVRSVPSRFKRLDWGIWIRRIAGSHKKLWKKNNSQRMRLERHVFVGATRSYMLDKMVSPYWRTPKYWVDDPYAPYHKREEFYLTRQNPRPLPPGVSFTSNS